MKLLIGNKVRECTCSVVFAGLLNNFPCTVVLAGEVLLGSLEKSGFSVVENHDDAQAIIVNTCGFVEDAKQESIEVEEHF